jgi:hypothetical protein
MFLTLLRFAYCMLADLINPDIIIFNLSPSLKKRGHEKDDKDSLRK